MIGVIAIALGSLAETATAQPLQVDEGAITGVLRALEAPAATEGPVLFQSDEGFIRFLGAPPGGAFLVRDSGAKATGPAAAAKVFVGDHAGAFGVVSGSTNFEEGTALEHRGSTFVRLNQHYEDIPVFGGQVVVQVDAAAGVRNVMSDIMRDTRALDNGSIALTPTLSSADALRAAANEAARTTDGYAVSDFSASGPIALHVYRPSIIGLSGATQLVWRLQVAASGAEPYHTEMLIDAHTGAVSLSYSLIENALDRQIFDADGSITIPNTPTRVEGDGPTGIEEVDNVYEFLGDTYDFYLNEHDYDSFDDNGSPIIATVNLPFANACWGCTLRSVSEGEEVGQITEMSFGIGYVLDDIVAHELTHGVTQFTSGLIYFGDSGAINESFSDMWGEWVDLTNGSENDTEENRWLIGEEFGPVLTTTPGIRSMKDPTLFGDPDRLGSPFRFDPTSFVDNGGVHFNSGIGNKLCYLLTDGDTFNGQTITGMGISAAADLFFGTQFILTPGADYNELFLALGASAQNLGLTFDERLNILRAGQAVEIVPESLTENGLRNFRATSTTDTSGNSVIALSWQNPNPDQFDEVRLLRSATSFPTGFTDGEEIARGTLTSFLDTEVEDGVTYYYSVIVDLASGVPQIVSARATAGATSANTLTESFDPPTPPDGSNAVDLAFSQLVFTPVGPPVGPGGLGGYDNYEATYHPNAFALPVAREDNAGRAIDITSPQDSGVIVGLGANTFPFFGQHYSQLYVAANGYISFEPIAQGSSLNFASLASHFSIPRISYLFAGAADLFDSLASSAGGSMWIRFLDDRVAITYENVPQFNPIDPQSAGATSTVQTELFYSGLIRITYLDAVATAAVVGLSDGRGVPVDPADLFPNVVSAGGLTDFTFLPDDNSQLHILPTPAASGAAGSLIEFDVIAVAPAGSDTIPELTGTWNGPGGLRFADNGDGTGTFSWETTLEDAGTYQMRVVAEADGQTAYQDITIQVGSVLQLPQATDLALLTDEPGEDPTQDRAIRTESFLTAAYTYSHPEQADTLGLFDEGATKLYWYRNNQIVTSFTNRERISPQATHGGDRWYFGVVPVTALGLAGPIAFSPTVTVSAIPEIVSVNPSAGDVMGGETVIITGNRLGSPISVSFGGTQVDSIASISNSEIEVVTPLHAPGQVDVVVTTTNGDGVLHNAFTYLGEGEAVAVTDINDDNKIDALDVQLVVNAVLGVKASKQDASVNPDANRDGRVDSSDIQMVVNGALLR